MEDYLKDKLQTEVFKKLERTSGGCISNGYCYQTDSRKVFLKTNSKSGADIMFNGEYESLKEIAKTKTVKVPEPLLTGKVSSKHFLLMEFFELTSLTKCSSGLGRNLAELHMDNVKKLSNKQNSVSPRIKPVSVDKFGFHVPTCCGYLPQSNDWCEDWVQFYACQRLLPQIKMIEREKKNSEITELWSRLQLKIPSFFKDLEVKPSLLHGDLWIGNVGETNDGAVIFDPASFYGHHEYDLAIAGMFGGFEKSFYSAYHALIPKERGFEKRHQLYQLFHHLNHWNHFGSHKHSSLSIMHNLLK